MYFPSQWEKVNIFEIWLTFHVDSAKTMKKKKKTNKKNTSQLKRHTEDVLITAALHVADKNVYEMKIKSKEMFFMKIRREILLF